MNFCDKRKQSQACLALLSEAKITTERSNFCDKREQKEFTHYAERSKTDARSKSRRQIYLYYTLQEGGKQS